MEQIRMLTHDVDDGVSAVDENWPTVTEASQILQITPSDREALRLLAAGHSNDDVALGLGISARAIEAQLVKLFAAMGAATPAEAVAAAHRRGLLERTR